MRAKRSAAARDSLPDEAFGRVRGALFFGPAFRVTRNKLTFRDNLAELLAAASPGARLPARRKAPVQSPATCCMPVCHAREQARAPRR